MRFRKAIDFPPTNGKYFIRSDMQEMHNGRMGCREVIYFNGQEWISLDTDFEWLDESHSGYTIEEIERAFYKWEKFRLGMNRTTIKDAWLAAIKWFKEGS